MTTYEELRNEAPGEGGDAWREADRDAKRLRELYVSLKEDARYNNDYKSETAWAAFDGAKGKIAENAAKARELLQKQARSAGEASLPFPPEEPLNTQDTNKLIASQNEASRIVRKLDRQEAKSRDGKGPFKPDKTGVLRGEYARGLEVGGVQGGAICRGALAAADEMGVDRESVISDFRKDRHNDALGRAEHYARLAGHVSKRVPEPPFPKPGARKGTDFHTGRTSSFLAERARDMRPAGRGPHWS